MKRLAVVMLVAACTKQQEPTSASIAATSSATPSSAAAASSSSTPATFPPIDDACKADSDCTTTGLFDTCCGNCELRYANKDYVTRAQAYCAARATIGCPPMGCSWGMAAPKCVDGKCGAATRTRVMIDKSTSCKEGELTYIGFRGTGLPPRALWDAVNARFPGAMVYEVKDGTLGVFLAEPYSMDARKRHEEAAATVPGWKGNVVDFARVAKDCSATFHTPMPPPPSH